MQAKIHLITLGVSDPEQSAGFYEQLFGLKRSPQSQGDVVFRKLDNLVLSPFPLKSLADDAGLVNDCGNYRGFSLAHNARSEREVDLLYKEAMAFGAKPLKAPHKAFWGGYSSYVADPDGNLIEIAFNPFFPFDNDGNLAI